MQFARVADTLLDIVKRVRFDTDGTLIPNPFQYKKEQDYFLKCLRVLFNFDSRQKAQAGLQENDEQIVFLLVELLTKNDDSLSITDDCYYLSVVVRLLLRSVSGKYFKQICGEMLRQLKIEFFNPRKTHYILCAMVDLLPEFLTKNIKQSVDLGI